VIVVNILTNINNRKDSNWKSKSVKANHFSGAVVVVILWLLDLKLPMQSVPTTTNIVSSTPTQARCTRYNIM